MNIIGLIFIFFAVVFTAFRVADSKLSLVREAAEIQELLKNLSHYISIYRIPVARAVEQILSQNRYTSSFIHRLGTELRNTNCFGDAYRVVQQAIAHRKTAVALEPLVDIMGMYESNTQLQAIERCCITLDKILDELSEKCVPEAVLYRKLGVISAIFVVVMLY